MKRSRAGSVVLKINPPSLSLWETATQRPWGGLAEMVGGGLVLMACVAFLGCSGGSPTPPPPDPTPPAPAETAPAANVPPATGVDPMSPTPAAAQPGAVQPGAVQPGAGQPVAAQPGMGQPAVAPGTPGPMPGDMPPGEPAGMMPGGPGMEMQAGMPGGYGQPQKKQRPQDLNQWKEADFLEAKKEGDHRLGEAAQHIAQTRKRTRRESPCSGRSSPRRRSRRRRSPEPNPPASKAEWSPAEAPMAGRPA